jgi:hypothetical protein
MYGYDIAHPKLDPVELHVNVPSLEHLNAWNTRGQSVGAGGRFVLAKCSDAANPEDNYCSMYIVCPSRKSAAEAGSLRLSPRWRSPIVCGGTDVICAHDAQNDNWALLAVDLTARQPRLLPLAVIQGLPPKCRMSLDAPRGLLYVSPAAATDPGDGNSIDAYRVPVPLLQQHERETQPLAKAVPGGFPLERFLAPWARQSGSVAVQRLSVSATGLIMLSLLTRNSERELDEQPRGWTALLYLDHGAAAADHRWHVVSQWNSDTKYHTLSRDGMIAVTKGMHQPPDGGEKYPLLEVWWLPPGPLLPTNLTQYLRFLRRGDQKKVAMLLAAANAQKAPVEVTYNIVMELLLRSHLQSSGRPDEPLLEIHGTQKRPEVIIDYAPYKWTGGLTRHLYWVKWVGEDNVHNLWVESKDLLPYKQMVADYWSHRGVEPPEGAVPG